MVYLMSYKFIDLFAGIGGFHLAMQRNGCECVFASERDPFARKTYLANHKSVSSEMFNKDINDQDISKIPNFDILCGGFPCQPFSQAGYKEGFNDKNRGELFFKIADIINKNQPSAVFLENVRYLLKHDNGRTFDVIRHTFYEMGYDLYYKVIKASDFNLPQHRPRLYMVAFKNGINTNPFEFPKSVPLTYTMSDVFDGNCNKTVGYTLRVGGRGSGIYDKRNWDSYIVDGVIRTIGVLEGKKMMGLPEDFIFPVSNTQAMKQLGNSVAINVVEIIGKKIVQYLDDSNT